LSQTSAGGGQQSSGVLIDVLGDLGGESSTDRPTGGKSVAPSGELDLIAGGSLPEDNFQKYVAFCLLLAIASDRYSLPTCCPQTVMLHLIMC